MDIENQQPQVSEELDLGLDTSTSESIQLDYEAALAKTKPDFQRLAKVLGIKGEGSTQEEIEASLLQKQQALESDLKENLVPKVQAALQAGLAKVNGSASPNIKPGVSISTPNPSQTRKTKAWSGY